MYHSGKDEDDFLLVYDGVIWWVSNEVSKESGSVIYPSWRAGSSETLVCIGLHDFTHHLVIWDTQAREKNIKLLLLLLLLIQVTIRKVCLCLRMRSILFSFLLAHGNEISKYG